MIKTEVPNLVYDGNNTFVNRDLSKYHEMVAMRKRLMAEQDSQRELATLREEVRELRQLVMALMENRK